MAGLHGGLPFYICARNRVQDSGDLVPNSNIRCVGTGPCDCEYVFRADWDLEWGAVWGRVLYLEEFDSDDDWEYGWWWTVCGAIYWYLYLIGEGDVGVSFDMGALQSAIEAGGPMGRVRKFHRAGRLGGGEGSVIDGVPSHLEGEEALKIASPGRGGKMHGDHLPHSGGPLQSAVGQELSEKYTKRKGSDESEKTAV